MDFSKINNKFNERKTAAKEVNLTSLIDEQAVSDAAEEISISKIDIFTDRNGRNQPFEIDEQKVFALQKSIEQTGQLEPIIVRRIDNGRYQLLAGHHRLAACKAADMSFILSRVVECDDWNAYKIVVESNIRHNDPKPSEIARILIEYKLNAKDNDENVSNQMLAQMFDISDRQLYRYFKIAQLSSEIVELIDNGYISTNSVDDIVKLKVEQQKVLSEYIYDLDKSINVGKCKKAVNYLIIEPELTAEELTERMTVIASPKDYKNEVFNAACSDFRLAAKLHEQTEEELSKLVISLLARHFGIKQEITNT